MRVVSSYRQTVAPADSMVTLAEAKVQLRVDGTDEDSLIQSLCKAADQIAENKTGRAFMQSTYEYIADTWDEEIIIYPAPLVSVESVKYYDSDNVEQTLAADQYVVSVKPIPGVIKFLSMPSLYDRRDAVTITYKVGYGAAAADVAAQRSAIPEDVKSWVKINLTTLYENRQMFTANTVGNIGTYTDTLIYPYLL